MRLIGPLQMASDALEAPGKPCPSSAGVASRVLGGIAQAGPLATLLRLRIAGIQSLRHDRFRPWPMSPPSAASTKGVLDEQTVSGQLQTALNSRIALEQAKGIVAEQTGAEMGEAFELLRGYARHHNRRLRDVVAEVIKRELPADQLGATLRTRSVTNV